MAVQLRDAKISVEIDIRKAGEDVASLEERTKRQREDAAKQEREQRSKRDKSRDAVRRRGGVAGALAARGVTEAIFGAARSIPLAGVVAGVGILAAELSEKFGPLAKGIIEELLPAELRKIIPDPAELGEFWRARKNELRSLTEGFANASSIAAADVTGGGTVTAKEFANIFLLARREAEFRADQVYYRRRLEQQIIGKSIGKETRDALRKAVQGSINR